MKKLNFSDIKLGLKVMDEFGDIGTIIECDDIHNIFVQFKDGDGLYCIDENCKEGTDILYLIEE